MSRSPPRADARIQPEQGRVWGISGRSTADHRRGDMSLVRLPVGTRNGDMDCERWLNLPHSAVIPPSTNSRAPVT